MPFLKEHQGLVIGTTIDKYSYITCRYNPDIFSYKTKLMYSEIEELKYNKDIQHKVIKAVVEQLEIHYGFEIAHLADLPSKSGLGSSSTFLVGLILALSNLSKKYLNPKILYTVAVEIEQEILKENVGLQDTAWASFGGFNSIEFNSDIYHPIITPISNTDFIKNLELSLLFFYTGIQRSAHEIAKVYTEKEKTDQQLAIYDMALEGKQQAISGNLSKFAKLVNESWLQKRAISPNISNELIDGAYDTAMDAGALGFKLCGAGAGGCIAIIANPSKHNLIRSRLNGLKEIKVKFPSEGAKIIYAQE